MPSKKKQKINKTRGSASELAEGEQPNSDPKTNEGEEKDKPVKGSLSEFVAHFKDRHYHVIEMRILTVCSLGIFYKLFMMDNVQESVKDMIVSSSFMFMALTIIVVMSSTWLDFFPSRLVEVKLRHDGPQGLPMACLLLPMTGCAQLYFALHYAKTSVDLLHLYLVILCVLSACTILGTAVHFIAHPTHVVFYNFAVLGVTYGLHHFIAVPMWLSLPAVAVYSLLGVWLIHDVPATFSMGEVVIVSQGITILLLDAAIQLVPLLGVASLPECLLFYRSESVLFLELLVVGVVLCCLLLSPALYKVATAKQHHDIKFWSATFILLSLSVGFMLILPWLGKLLGGHHPIPYLFFNCVSSVNRIILLVVWVVVCVVTAVMVSAQSSTGAWAQRLKITSDTMTQRKIFHVSGAVIYLTGIILDVRFTALVSSSILFLFIVLELCRVFNMWPFGVSLRQFFQRFMDDKDSGTVVVSNLYLLVGVAAPLWLSPLRTFNKAARLAMYSGVLSLGVGDTVASIIGKGYGKIKLKGTKKTVEGSVAFVVSQLLTLVVLSILDPHLGVLAVRQWVVLSVCVVITAAMEAYTHQIDNLTLPILQYTLTISFLT